MLNKENIEKILDLIKIKMKEQGYNYSSLARKMGITEGAVRLWFINGIDNMKLSNAKKLCKILDIKPLIFMGFESIYNDETYQNYNRLKKYDKEEIEQLKNMIALIEKDK